MVDEHLKELLKIQTQTTREFTKEITELNTKLDTLIDLSKQEVDSLNVIQGKFQNGFKTEIINNLIGHLDTIVEPRIKEEIKKESRWIVRNLIGGLSIISFIIGAIVILIGLLKGGGNSSNIPINP